MPAWSLPDGRQIHTHHRGEGDPPIVFLPGAGADHTAFGYLARHLSPRHRCILLDWPDPALPTESTQSLAGAVAHALHQESLTGAVLLGHSLGSAVALTLVLNGWPARGLILLSPWPGPTGGTDLLFRALVDLVHHTTPEVYAPVLTWLLGSVDLLRSPEMARSLHRGMWENPRSPSPSRLLAHLRAGQAHDVRPRLPEVSVPALVLAGTQDRMVPYELSHQVAVALPKARWQPVPEAGHLLHYERHELVASHILAWMAETNP